MPRAGARRRSAARRARRSGEGAAPGDASRAREDSLARSATENAPRVAALVARAIRARELSMLDVWFASLGPVASALLEAAVRARDPPDAAAAAAAEEEGAEGHRGLRAREAARRGRHRHGVARAQARRRPLLRAQDPEGRRARRTRPTPSARASSRRSSRRRRRSPASTTRTSPTSSIAASPAACRSWCSST